MLLLACPSCNASERRRWHRHPELSLWLCGRCGLGYSDPQPRDVVEARYLSGYDLAEHFGAHEARKRVLNTRRLDRLPTARPGQRLLDVGCADGQFAAAARERGWDAHGVELNPPAAERARERGVTVIEGRLEDVEIPKPGFDVVTAWDVIEHIPAPQAFVERLVAALAPGGLLVLTTLNRRAAVAKAFRGRWSMIVVDHFTYWDARSLRAAFDGTGLCLIDTTSFGLGRDFVFWIDRLRRRPSWHADTAASGPAAPKLATGVGWDTHGLVLAVERRFNQLLNATRTGVGIEMVFRAPRPAHASSHP